MRRKLAQIAIIGTSLFLMILSSPRSASAQSLDNDQGAIELNGPSISNESEHPISVRSNQPRVGRKAAARYMSASPRESSRESENITPGDHYLAIHLGTFVSDTAYQWGGPDMQNNVGKWTFGLTYKMGEWVNSMDLSMRVDLSSYRLNEGSATKISFVPLITFPDATSRFPLYFGVGAGLGVFASQLSGKSPLSIDYQVVAGARFFDVFRNTGFFVEAGLKNHFLILSEGQFNGTFVAVGAIFTF